MRGSNGGVAPGKGRGRKLYIGWVTARSGNTLTNGAIGDLLEEAFEDTYARFSCRKITRRNMGLWNTEVSNSPAIRPLGLVASWTS